MDWFASTEVSTDLGYQGIKTDYLSPENITFLIKNHASRKRIRSSVNASAKRENRRIGRVVSSLEHAIGGMKVFRVLTMRLRTIEAFGG